MCFLLPSSSPVTVRIVFASVYGSLRELPKLLYCGVQVAMLVKGNKLAYGRVVDGSNLPFTVVDMWWTVTQGREVV